MPEKKCSFDASILRINDDSPVKVTFLKGDKGAHFIGFYSMADGAFQDTRTLFANTESETLISGVSSVFLGNRLNGKTPVFFIIENGAALNKNSEWFSEASLGQGGIWKFLKPPSAKGAIPVLNQGTIAWQSGEKTFERAQDADASTKCPVLVWLSNGGGVFLAEGRVFHSAGGGLHTELNPDTSYRFFVTLGRRIFGRIRCRKYDR